MPRETDRHCYVCSCWPTADLSHQHLAEYIHTVRIELDKLFHAAGTIP